MKKTDKHLTIRQLITEASRLIDTDETEYLAMAFFKLPRHQLYLSQKLINPKTVERFFRLVRKASKGVPVQYLINSTQFLNLDLFVDKRVFIPRPETEELVMKTSVRLKEAKVILDYGTGSGCIAITLACIFPNAQVFALDISDSALQVALINVRRYGLQRQIQLKHITSLNDPSLKFLIGQVDLFISNPPYIPTSRIDELPDNVKKYEPIIALDGGSDGLKVISMLIDLAPNFIRNGGILALEIDDTQKWFIKSKMPDAILETDFNHKIRYAFWQKK